MAKASKRSTATAGAGGWKSSGAPFHITDWTPWPAALDRVAQVAGRRDRAAEALRHGMMAGEIEAIVLRVFRWGDKAEYNLPGPEKQGVEIYPLPHFWDRLLHTARPNERGDLLTPDGQDIFMICPRPHLRRADVERLWPRTECQEERVKKKSAAAPVGKVDALETGNLLERTKRAIVAVRKSRNGEPAKGEVEMAEVSKALGYPDGKPSSRTYYAARRLLKRA